jgi:ubiquinone/menaquinone biosynthesis C-methylase UbiE
MLWQGHNTILTGGILVFIDQQIRFELIGRHLPAAPASIFEVGCGGGEMLRWLEGKGYDIQGCETNRQHVADATQWAKRDQVILASGAQIPVNDNTFDCVTSCDVLEHVVPEQRETFLNEMLRITKTGGRIVLTAWFYRTLTFKLYGVLYLMVVGDLPDWYMEHLAIPVPSTEMVKNWFGDHCDDVKLIPYQGSMNQMVMLTQHAASAKGSWKWQHRFHRLDSLAKNCDWLGRRTSCLFVGTKRGS